MSKVLETGVDHFTFILGHVYDLGNDPTQIDKVRIYSTHARQFFHVDDADMVRSSTVYKPKESCQNTVC